MSSVEAFGALSLAIKLSAFFSLKPNKKEIKIFGLKYFS
jgi:hypothetical protein